MRSDRQHRKVISGFPRLADELATYYRRDRRAWVHISGRPNLNVSTFKILTKSADSLRSGAGGLPTIWKIYEIDTCPHIDCVNTRLIFTRVLRFVD